ncbi:acyl transferase 4 [Punica granatum]|uniref:Uncharacterized protein n=2 Tax=Punica granatum TaxID=22663 RepID=A0A218X4V5_PUNGR|nr:acyl transferase 4 [Punica granatum]OWM79726.1 hypothetical protein CDL15_Pgr023138 [Punica granatum]PKI68648.1 hypothetical protein CRG98_010928 [Punica granatum]
MALSVVRSAGILIKPSEKTPSVTLDLSAIDRIPVLRCNARTLHVFKHGPGAARVLQAALSKALVPYYPLAGRLTEPVPGQLQVECCTEGVRFVEAMSGCILEEVDYFQDVESIPYDELLPEKYEDPDGREPLIQMQVTQFACGGFVIGLIFCHSICDGLGAAQFLHAVGEFARGHESLTIDPIWHRNFFTSHKIAPDNPPMFPLSQPPPMPNYQLNHANIDVPLDQITRLKLKSHELMGQNCSTFEAVAASFWRSRTQAVRFDPGTQVMLVFFANCRDAVDPPLPKGFYGNCFFPVTIEASSDWIEKASFADVVKLIQQAKSKLPIEFARYMQGECHVDPFAPPLVYTTLFMSEWGRLGFNQVDYGWGPPVHVVPIQGSSIIPVGIVGVLPLPQKGIRLMTWCIEEDHKQGLLNHMGKVLSTPGDLK